MSVDVRVVGVGGGGSNSVSALVSRPLFGASLYCFNTDAQALSDVPHSIRTRLLGQRLTNGLGAGGKAQRGFDAAMESRHEIRECLAGADLVFVTAGLGGGTGTGAAPVVAHEARELGATVVGVVTRPFGFEGKRRAHIAEQGFSALSEQVDAIVTIENGRLISALDDGADLSIADAMARADEVLADAVSGIGELVGRNAMVNLDFANVRALLRDGGRAVLGRGAALNSEGGAEMAVCRAISCPLLDSDSIAGAKRIVFQLTAGSELSLRALEAASLRLEQLVHPDAEIAFGVALDEAYMGRAEATVLATAIESPQAGSNVGVAKSASPLQAERPRNALVML